MQTIQNKIERKSAFHYTVHTETLINAPTERIWAILMDPPELAKWSTSFQGMQGKFKPGGVVTVSFLIFGHIIKPVHALTAFEENRIFAWSDPIVPGLRDHHQYILEPLSPTQTRFIQKDEVKGPLALPLGSYAVNLLLNLYQDFNTKLKICAEKTSAAEG